MHPTPLDADYMRRVLGAARQYSVDSFEICGACHSENGGLDGLVSYEGYGGLAETRSLAQIDRNRAALQEITSMARAEGKPVLYWHREVMVPEALAKKLPGLLDADGEFDLLGDAYEQLLRYKIDRALAAVPELGGVVLTLTESDYSVIHNSRPDRYPPTEIVAKLVRVFAGELQSRGKRFVLRSFGSIASDYEDILKGAREAAREFSFEIETKITPYDFVPFLPVNPWLKRVPGTTLGAETDCVGEFLGAGMLPAANIDNIVRYVRAAQEQGTDRYVIRLDRLGTSIFDTSYEINLQAYHAAIEDPSVTAAALKERFASAHGEAAREGLRRLVDAGLHAVERINFIEGNAIFHTFPLDPSLKWLKAAGFFALFRPGTPLAKHDGIWSILADRNTPSTRDEIVAEKNKARRLSAEMRQTLALLSTQLPPELFGRLEREWGNAEALAGLYAAFCHAVCAYFDGIESGDQRGLKLDAAIADAASLFGAWLTDSELALAPGSQGDREAYHGIFDIRGSEFKEVYARPLWVILQKLRLEYDAEMAARSRWSAAKGVVDLIVFGAATDEWRLSRYMHASHARCDDGRLSRQVGNSVFPNGFLEFEMKRPASGGELILEGRPGQESGLFVTLDGGEGRRLRLSEAGVSIKLPNGGGETVRVRLQKDGPRYPEVCIAAVVGH